MVQHSGLKSLENIHQAEPNYTQMQHSAPSLVDATLWRLDSCCTYIQELEHGLMVKRKQNCVRVG